MRTGLAVLMCLAFIAMANAQQDQDATPPRRYGVLLNQQNYPQDDPKQALASASTTCSPTWSIPTLWTSASRKCTAATLMSW